jgi:hypothetical protein
MGVVIEMCAKCPGGRTRIRVTDMRMSLTCNGSTHGDAHSLATCGFICVYVHTAVWRTTSGRRTPRWAAGRRAACYGSVHCTRLRYGRRKGTGGSPNAEAGKMHQHHPRCCLHSRVRAPLAQAILVKIGHLRDLAPGEGAGVGPQVSGILARRRREKNRPCEAPRYPKSRFVGSPAPHSR